MSAAYNLPVDLTGADRPFAWWCRGCGEFTAVDDHEQCERCIPSLGPVLRAQLREHISAYRAVVENSQPGDVEGVYNLDAAMAVLELARRLAGFVEEPEDEGLDRLRCSRCHDLDCSGDCA